MKQLKKRRTARKLTQAQLAKKVGMRQGSISALESGTRRASMRAAERIAKALNITLAQLL